MVYWSHFTSERLGRTRFIFIRLASAVSFTSILGEECSGWKYSWDLLRKLPEEIYSAKLTELRRVQRNMLYVYWAWRSDFLGLVVTIQAPLF